MRKLTKYTIVLCAWASILSAQDTLKVPQFVKTEFNRLYFGADSNAFIRLFEKMDRLGTDPLQRLSIIQMGGSHVQAGIWSHTFAADLQYASKLNGGGYFGFPYKLAKTNGQHYLVTFGTGKWKKCRAVTVDYCLPLGLSGLSVANNDSTGNFGCKLTERAACRYVNNVRVYHNFNPSFQFFVGNVNPDKVTRIDNVKAGYSLFSFEAPIDSIVFNFQRNDTLQRDFILYGFSLENDLTSGVYLAALGVNGASSASFLRCSEFTRQLPSLQGDLFILSLGVNDTQAADFSKETFTANYDSLISIIRSVNPDAAIILTTTTDNYIRRKTPNKRSAISREVMFDLCTRRNVAVWDMYSLMGGYKSMPKWVAAGLASQDRVHFTPRGYVMLGHLMYQSLMTSFTAYKQLNINK